MVVRVEGLADDLGIQVKEEVLLGPHHQADAAAPHEQLPDKIRM